MRFWCVHKDTGNIVYYYLDDGENFICKECLNLNQKTEQHYDCRNGFYHISRLVHDRNHIFHFCIKKRKNYKQLKPLIKQTINAFYQSQDMARSIAKVSQSATELALHNTKNLHAEINNKLLSLLDEKQLAVHEDKINYITEIIQDQPQLLAREILSIVKSLGQIIHEYSIIDFMNRKIKLSSTDFSQHKAHTLCVMSFYMYETEFSERQISVNIGHFYNKINVHWETAKTAVSQIFDNCLKYCKPGSKIQVSFKKVDSQHLAIIFKMTSLYFSNEESVKLTLPNYRGSFANKHQLPGKGTGMAIVQRMMELNNGSVTCEPGGNSYISEGMPYSQNTFVLKFKTQ